MRYLHTTFPAPPAGFSGRVIMPDGYPSHLVLTGHLLEARAGGPSKATARQLLHDHGYRETWHGFNGFDILQSEAGWKGGVRVWQRA